MPLDAKPEVPTPDGAKPSSDAAAPTPALARAVPSSAADAADSSSSKPPQTAGDPDGGAAAVVPAQAEAAEKPPEPPAAGPKPSKVKKASKRSKAVQAGKTAKASQAKASSTKRRAPKGAAAAQAAEHAGAHLAAAFAPVSEPAGPSAADGLGAKAAPTAAGEAPAPTAPTADIFNGPAGEPPLEAAAKPAGEPLRNPPAPVRVQAGKPSKGQKTPRALRPGMPAADRLPTPSAASAVLSAEDPAPTTGAVFFEGRSAETPAQNRAAGRVLELEASMSSLTPIVSISDDSMPINWPKDDRSAAEPVRIERRAASFPKNPNGIAIMSRSRTVDLGAAMGNALGEALEKAQTDSPSLAAPSESAVEPTPAPEMKADPPPDAPSAPSPAAGAAVTVLAGPRKAFTRKSKADRLPPLETLAPLSVKADMADVRALEEKDGLVQAARSLKARRDAVLTERLERGAARALEAAVKDPAVGAAIHQSAEALDKEARLLAGLTTPSAAADAPWYLQGIEAVEAHLDGLAAAGALDAADGADPGGCAEGISSSDEALALRSGSLTIAALGEALCGLLTRVRALQAAIDAPQEPSRYEYAASSAAKSLVVVLRRFAKLSQSHAENARAMLELIEADGLLRPDLSDERLRAKRRPAGFQWSGLRPLVRDAGARALGLLAPRRAGREPVRETLSAPSQSMPWEAPPGDGKTQKPPHRLRRLVFIAAAGAAVGVAAGLLDGAGWFGGMAAASAALDSAVFAAAAQPVRADADAVLARAARIRLSLTDPKTGIAAPEAQDLTRERIDEAVARWERAHRRWIVNWPNRNAEASPFEPAGALLKRRLESRLGIPLTGHTPTSLPAESLEALPDATQELMQALPGLSAYSTDSGPGAAPIDDEALAARIAARWGFLHDPRP